MKALTQSSSNSSQYFLSFIIPFFQLYSKFWFHTLLPHVHTNSEHFFLHYSCHTFINKSRYFLARKFFALHTHCLASVLLLLSTSHILVTDKESQSYNSVGLDTSSRCIITAFQETESSRSSQVFHFANYFSKFGSPILSFFLLSSLFQ